MRNLIGMLMFVVLVVGVAAAASPKADELRAKAKALQKQAEQLSQEGRRDEAEKVGREVKELLQAAQQYDQKSPTAGHGEIDELQQTLKALAEKEQALKESKNEEGLA
ncbi:MAG TPA: hypothetical protein VK137_08600, partial [Planctomycetaceae bacterium]|nr:hypothetical protein [Planctomycetaceae bacterium]